MAIHFHELTSSIGQVVYKRVTQRYLIPANPGQRWDELVKFRIN